VWCVWDWVVEGVEVFCFVGGEGGGGGGGHLVVCGVRCAGFMVMEL